MDIAGFTFEPPPGFRTEEMTVGMRLGAMSGPSPSLMLTDHHDAREGAAEARAVSQPRGGDWNSGGRLITVTSSVARH